MANVRDPAYASALAQAFQYGQRCARAPSAVRLDDLKAAIANMDLGELDAVRRGMTASQGHRGRFAATRSDNKSATP